VPPITVALAEGSGGRSGSRLAGSTVSTDESGWRRVAVLGVEAVAGAEGAFAALVDLVAAIDEAARPELSGGEGD
jgi:hypothetical protein